MSTTVELPLRFLTFPARCFVCRRAAETTRAIDVTKGFFIGHAGHASVVRVQVPLCRDTASQIRAIRVLAYLGLTALFFALTGALFVSGLNGNHVWMVVVAAMLFLGAPFVLNAVLPQYLDLWQLGVAGVTHRDHGMIVKLAFRSEQDAAEVARLTADRVEGRVPAAEQEFERQQQEIAAKKPRMAPRLVTFLFAAGAAVALLVDHSTVQESGKFSILISLVGPMVLLLGLAGTIDPRLAVALGKYGTGLPTRLKIISKSVAIVGLAAGLLLTLHYLGYV